MPSFELVSTAQSRRVLLIATRDPRGALTGRKTVLRTIISSLRSLGHTVFVAHFGAPDDAAPQHSSVGEVDVRYISLPRPGSIELTTSLLLGFVPGRQTLNEGLYASRSARKQLERLVREHGIDVIVTDMIRTAPYGEDLNLPWIADLDDLLSLRYARLARQAEAPQGLLGYHNSRALRAAMRLARPFVRGILNREASIMARREIAVARSRALVSTVSSTEAARLAYSSGRPIADTPMAISGPDQVLPLDARPNELVFLGSFNYTPNRRSVQEFDRNVLPKLDGYGIDRVRLDVIGAVMPADRFGLSERVSFLGYVEDLDTILQSYRTLLVTAVLQGGIKTKIIHAALNGTVVLSHPDALEGMGLQPDREVLVWRTAEELAHLLRRSRNRDPSLTIIAENARVWAQSRFSPAVLKVKWAEHLRKVT
ncbi:MAG: glycosyltransferase [Candidatus Kaistia colombiensis]|nr:MAG: glycosyltransferase [Kaistia sp.]